MALSVATIMWAAVVGAVVAYAASWLHELSHAVAAIAVGGSVTDIRVWPVMSVGVADIDGRALAFARHTPFLFGIVCAPLLVSLSAPLWAWAGWAVLSFSGGDGEIGLGFLGD